ncbi:RagB/SusD family nutrient uptake outer membrane protein [Chitinophaga sp.]|uniref:RagB/SusD family nutrient uptake outer membrane protein n=2 Tax=Chitinophaga TaxID=79328 RepID=UPI002FDE4E9F
MQQLKIWALGGMIAVAAAACNTSLLDVNPTDRYLQNTFWQNMDQANAGLNGCYSILRNDGIYGGKGSNNATPLWEECATPNQYGNTMNFGTMARSDHSAATGGIITARWADAYGGIGRCNTFLDNAASVPGMSQANLERMSAQALFLRALYYSFLTTYYGDAPLILHTPDPNKDGTRPRTPRALVMTQIFKDLDSAAKYLPAKYTAATDKGRVTKGAALALKARLLLFEASPLMNPSGDLQKWKDAENAAKAVMDMAGQAGDDLFDDHRALFLPQNENNKEVIFDVQYMWPEQGNSFDLICRQYNTNAPLLDLVMAYPMDNGLFPTEAGSGYDPAKPYENRDPRMYATLTFPGDMYMGNIIDDKRFAITGFGMKKFSIYDREAPPSDKSSLVGGQSETNFIVLRYADVLMMYAEARNETSGADATVYAALKEIRDRVDMPEIAAGLNQTQMREAIRKERRIEFAGEATYYNDIRRWKTIETVMNSDAKKYNGSFLETRKFDVKRDYWWPIPTGERDLNPKLDQNPFY